MHCLIYSLRRLRAALGNPPSSRRDKGAARRSRTSRRYRLTCHPMGPTRPNRARGPGDTGRSASLWPEPRESTSARARRGVDFPALISRAPVRFGRLAPATIPVAPHRSPRVSLSFGTVTEASGRHLSLEVS